MKKTLNKIMRTIKATDRQKLLLILCAFILGIFMIIQGILTFGGAN